MEAPNPAHQRPNSQLSKLWKTRKKQIITVSIVLTIILLAVFTTREPDTEIKSIKVKDLSYSETWMLFEITVEIDNGNIIGGTLNSLDVDIRYNDEYIGHATITENYEIRALGRSTIRLDVRIDNLPSEISLLPEIKCKGIANVTVFFLTFDQPVEKTVMG